MYPKQHAVLSAAGVALVGLFMRVEPLMLVLWISLGTVAGVFIDIDHALLPILFHGRVSASRYWFRHPIRAVLHPDWFLRDVDYERLVYHRLLSHFVIAAVLGAMMSVHPLIIPVFVGVVVHVAADIVWDVKQGTYLRE